MKHITSYPVQVSGFEAHHGTIMRLQYRVDLIRVCAAWGSLNLTVRSRYG